MSYKNKSPLSSGDIVKAVIKKSKSLIKHYYSLVSINIQQFYKQHLVYYTSLSLLYIFGLIVSNTAPGAKSTAWFYY
jgi:hypothetical protein